MYGQFCFHHVFFKWGALRLFMTHRPWRNVMEKFIIAVSTWVLAASAVAKRSFRSNNPGQEGLLERRISPRSYMMVATIVLVVIGCAALQVYAADEEKALALSLDKYGVIVEVASADGNPLKYDSTERSTLDNGNTWIATIGACWRKVGGKWGLHFICAKSGDEGQEARLWIKIGAEGRIIDVQECTASLGDCAQGQSRQPLVYADPNETMLNSKLMSKNHWCWRVVGGVLKCLHVFCS